MVALGPHFCIWPCLRRSPTTKSTCQNCPFGYFSTKILVLLWIFQEIHKLHDFYFCFFASSNISAKQLTNIIQLHWSIYFSWQQPDGSFLWKKSNMPLYCNYSVPVSIRKVMVTRKWQQNAHFHEFFKHSFMLTSELLMCTRTTLPETTFDWHTSQWIIIIATLTWIGHRYHLLSLLLWSVRTQTFRQDHLLATLALVDSET